MLTSCPTFHADINLKHDAPPTEYGYCYLKQSNESDSDHLTFDRLHFRTIYHLSFLDMIVILQNIIG
jgi:hypothetical protein